MAYYRNAECGIDAPNLPDPLNLPMLLEVEQKYPIADLAAMRHSLAALGATFEPAVEQADLYFAHPIRNFKETDEALRIRRVGNENFITYKGPKLDATTKTRREIELRLASGEEGYRSFAKLLEVLGFGGVYEVRKERIAGVLFWEERQVDAALDTVRGLGTFLELELLTDPGDLEAAKDCLASLAQKLQLSTSQRRGYLDLLLEKEGISH